jgi:predicted kinase
VVISRDAMVMKIGKGSTYKECWKSLSEDEHVYINNMIEESFRDAVKQRKNIVVDMMNLSRKSRKKWLEIAGDAYMKKAKVFLTSFSEVKTRNQKQRIFKHMEEEILESMARRFEYPLYDEVDTIEVLHSQD